MKNLPLVRIVAAFTLIASNCWSVAYAQGIEAVSVVPMDIVQTKFRELAELGLVASASKPETMERYEKLVREIVEEVDGDKIVLLRQWLYFFNEFVLAQEGERRSNMAMVMQYLFQKFAIEKKDMAYAFYPLLETQDKGFLKLVKRYLGWSHSVRGKSDFDFSSYEAILKEELKEHGDIPASLVQYMYETSPGNALISMMELDKETFLALKSALGITGDKTQWPLSNRWRIELKEEHAKAAITAELEGLSNRPEWWVQLFAAEFAAQVPDVGNESIRSNLSLSENALVKAVLSKPDKYREKGSR